MEGIETLHIDLSTLSSQTYDNLMNEMTSLFGNIAEHNFRGVPVTTGQTGWFIISLDVPNSPSVQMLINKKNGYFTAFQDGEGHWYRFHDTEEPPAEFNAQLIAHLNASYRSLAKVQIAVGPQAALDSYHNLVNFNNELPLTDPRVDVQRRALGQLATMICEGVRLRTIRTLVSHQMGMFINTVIDEVSKKKITSWSLMSSFALHCWRREQDGQEGFKQQELDKVASCGINSIEEVAGDPAGELLLIMYINRRIKGVE